MTDIALALVVASALMHAVWNLLLKRSNNPEIFTWWLLTTASIIFLPLAVVLFITRPIEGPGWWFVLGTVVIHSAYFTTLARSYAQSDFSLVYPIARGLGPSLVPIIGTVVLHEVVAIPAAVGIGLVVSGIATIHWWGRFVEILKDPLRLLRQPGIGYALLTGILIAFYSVWDKVGVGHVHPLLYLYLVNLGVSLSLSGYQLRTFGPTRMITEWRRNRIAITISAILAFSAYGGVLAALTTSRVSYVAPAREVGIVFGVILGLTVLKEELKTSRIVGSFLIVSGLILLAAF